MAGVDINRSTSGVYLPPAVSNDILSDVQAASAVMQLGRQVTLPGSGVRMPVITGDPEAEWVAETDEKPVGRGSFGYKDMRGYTLAVIEPFSNQFRRDLPALYQTMAQRLPGVLAKKFDSTVFYGTAPGSDFDTFVGAPAVSIANTEGGTNSYTGFLGALATVAQNGGNVSGWALSAMGEITALSALDANGRPLFGADPVNDGSVGRVLGRPVYRTEAVGDPAATPVSYGFGGDWSTAVWGIVENISVSISDQATLTEADGTTLNLWQRNMFAVRCEFEVGFRFQTENKFVRLTGAPATP